MGDSGDHVAAGTGHRCADGDRGQGLLAVDLVVSSHKSPIANALPEIRCWLNYGHLIVLGTIVPIGAVSAVTVIITEAAGMDARRPIDKTGAVAV